MGAPGKGRARRGAQAERAVPDPAEADLTTRSADRLARRQHVMIVVPKKVPIFIFQKGSPRGSAASACEWDEATACHYVLHITNGLCFGFSIANAERMENRPWKMMLIY